jgi:hypothetical protein
VVDALSGQVAFLWVRNGTVDVAKEDHDLAILLDIGALDVKELVGRADVACIVLTEDALRRPLEIVVESSDFPIANTVVLPYYGCTSPHNLRALLGVIHGTNPSAKIIVHRDRDYLTDAEANKWQTDIRALRAEPFLTDGVDIESHFLNARHLVALNSNLSEEEGQALIDQATTETRELSIQKYVNGRVDIEKKHQTYGKLDVGKLATEAPRAFDSNPVRYRHSKTVMRKLRELHRGSRSPGAKDGRQEMRQERRGTTSRCRRRANRARLTCAVRASSPWAGKGDTDFAALCGSPRLAGGVFAGVPLLGTSSAVLRARP